MADIHRKTVLLTPLRIGEILDRGFLHFLKLFRVVLPFSLVNAIVAAVYVQSASPERLVEDLGMGLLLLILLFLLLNALYLYFRIFLSVLSKQLWLLEPAELRSARSRASVGTMIKVFVLSLRVSLFSTFYSLFLVIPGLVYFINRSLADYVLVLENYSVGEALYKSRRLMTHRPGIAWYSTGSPGMRLSGIYIIVLAVWAASSVLMVFPVQRESLLISFLTQFLSNLATAYSVVVMVGFYLDLRIRAEGLDLMREIGRLEDAHATAS